MKKTALVIAMGINALLLTTPALANTGKVTIIGDIVDAPCSVHPDSRDQTVDLGQISTTELTTGDKKSNARPFSIKLENCNIATKNKVTVTFSGVTDANEPALLAIGGGTAGNAGVVLTGVSGSAVAIGTATAAINLTNGNNQLDFSAALKGYDVQTGKAPIPGSFTATTNFVLAYN